MGRYLKRNHGTEAPSNLIFLDTESYKEDRSDTLKRTANRLRLWCATNVRLESGKVTRRKEDNGLTAGTFWKFVDDCSTDERCTWIFGHHLSNDLTQLGFWHELDAGRFTTNPMKCKKNQENGKERNSWIGKLCLESTPFWVQVRNGRKTYKMVCTFNYWQCKLKDIGESIGLPKLECDTDTPNLAELLVYCKRDTEIVEKAVCQLIYQWKETNSGVLQPTSASLALHNFMHICPIRTPDSKSVDIVCEPGHRKNVLERESYFGGRIQSFFVGEVHSPVYHVDCNSLYPYVMHKYSYPRRFVAYERNVPVDRLETMSKVYGLCAKVALSARYDTFPVRIDRKQYHTVGQYWTALCGAELLRGIETRSINRVATVQLYSVAPLFRDWVCEWYERKVRAERLGDVGLSDRMFAKLLLNSLSGKWAQHGRTWTDRPGEWPLTRWGAYPAKESSTGDYKRLRGVAGHLQELTDGKEPDHAFPLISACITSNAREYMRTVIGTAGEGNVYYMATDSLMLNKEGYDNLQREGYIHPSDLGRFKLVGIHRYACFHGPNDYVLGEKQVVSGSIGKARLDARGILVADIWDRTPSVISKGPTDEIVITTVPAYYPHHTNRGRIGKDGWWGPYRITDDIDFTDRPRKGSHFGTYSLDMEGDRILPTV